MSNKLTKLAIFSLSLSLLVFERDAHADRVCIALTAEVTAVNDTGGVMAGAVNVGDVIGGMYFYETTTPDTSPTPTVGDYLHTTPPFGITINAGGLVFRTDSNDVYFLVEVGDDHGFPASDFYLVRSYNNLTDVGLSGVYYIAWQLADATLTALSSASLPPWPPDLVRWQSNELSINSRDFPEDFQIRSHVTAARFCGPAPARCHGQVATIIGSSSDDVLLGTSGDDIISAGNGNDLADGGGGNDVICGGPGDDTLLGGNGDDRLFGESGSDTLDGEAGNDSLSGAKGSDVLRGGPGRDTLRGGAGFDTCDGNTDRDTHAGGCEILISIP